MKAFHYIVWKLSKVLFALSLMCVFLMMAHVTIDVLSRTLFNNPLHGTSEITASWYMVTVAFLPFGWVTLRNQHVTADIFSLSFKPALSHLISMLTDLLCIAYLSVFTWQTWLSAIKMSKRGEVWEIYGGYLPVWPIRWMLPVTGAVMIATLFLHFFARLLNQPKYLSE